MITAQLVKSHILTSYDPNSNRTYYTTYDWQGRNVGGSYWYNPPNSFSFSPPNTDGIIGTTDLSLAEKYTIPYVKMTGGNNIEIYQPYEFSTLAESQAYIQAVAAKIAADTRAGALALEQQQLSEKTEMLGSASAVWGSETAYTAQVAETTAEIRAFNADVAAFLATAPAGEVQQAQQAGVSIQSKPAAQASAPGTAGEKKDNTGIIIAGVAIAVAGAILLGGRK